MYFASAQPSSRLRRPPNVTRPARQRVRTISDDGSDLVAEPEVMTRFVRSTSSATRIQGESTIYAGFLQYMLLTHARMMLPCSTRLSSEVRGARARTLTLRCSGTPGVTRRRRPHEPLLHGRWFIASHLPHDRMRTETGKVPGTTWPPGPAPRSSMLRVVT